MSMSHWFSCGRRDFLIDCTRGGLESNFMVYIGGSNLYFQKKNLLPLSVGYVIAGIRKGQMAQVVSANK